MRGSPPLQKAVEVLSDGQWHDFIEVLLAVMTQVEPSKAIRRCERERKSSLVRHKSDPDRPRARPMKVWQQQRIGARTIARETLLKSPRFEVQWLRPDGSWINEGKKAPRGARARIRLDPTYVFNARPKRSVESQRRVELALDLLEPQEDAGEQVLWQAM